MEHAGFTVLVVDDSATLRSLIGQALLDAGFHVIEACHGRMALDVLARDHVDLLTLDVEMPEMDGFETCRRIRADPRLSHLPVIMITGLGGAEELRKGFHAGVTEYFLKPFEPDTIVAAVSRYLQFNPDLALGDIAVITAHPNEVSLIRSGAELAHLRPRTYADAAAYLAAGGPCEIVAMDLGTDVDGAEYVASVREKSGFDVPLIVISDGSDPQAVVRAYMHGASDHMIKPFDARILTAKIQALIRSRRYQSLMDENRIQKSRIDLFRELNLALSHHMNNILAAFLLNFRYIESHGDREVLGASFRNIEKSLSQMGTVLDSLRKTAEQGTIELEKYVADAKMLKIDR